MLDSSSELTEGTTSICTQNVTMTPNGLSVIKEWKSKFVSVSWRWNVFANQGGILWMILETKEPDETQVACIISENVILSE